MKSSLALRTISGSNDAEIIDLASIALVEMTFAALSQSSRLTVLQTRVLLTIHQHGSTNLQDLSTRLAVSTSSASRVVDRLVLAGLLSRVSAPHSRREIALTLTSRGNQVLAEFHDRRRAAIEAAMNRLSPAERTALVAGLEAFAREAASP
jgi:DNA-binding MarR family transcriptional regulator